MPQIALAIAHCDDFVVAKNGYVLRVESDYAASVHNGRNATKSMLKSWDDVRWKG